MNRYRIGNLVESKEGFISEICEISSDNIQAKYKSFYGGVNHEYIVETKNELKNIELTNEWLTRFGFDLDKGVGVWFSEYKKDSFRFTIWNKYSNVPYKFSINNSLYLDIKYVHQLQNLYFTLTGLELKNHSD